MTHVLAKPLSFHSWATLKAGCGLARAYKIAWSFDDPGRVAQIDNTLQHLERNLVAAELCTPKFRQKVSRLHWISEWQKPGFVSETQTLLPEIAAALRDLPHEEYNKIARLTAVDMGLNPSLIDSLTDATEWQKQAFLATPSSLLYGAEIFLKIVGSPLDVLQHYADTADAFYLTGNMHQARAYYELEGNQSRKIARRIEDKFMQHRRVRAEINLEQVPMFYQDAKRFFLRSYIAFEKAGNLEAVLATANAVNLLDLHFKDWEKRRT